MICMRLKWESGAVWCHRTQQPMHKSLTICFRVLQVTAPVQIEFVFLTNALKVVNFGGH